MDYIKDEWKRVSPWFIPGCFLFGLELPVIYTSISFGYVLLIILLCVMNFYLQKQLFWVVEGGNKEPILEKYRALPVSIWKMWGSKALVSIVMNIYYLVVPLAMLLFYKTRIGHPMVIDTYFWIVVAWDILYVGSILAMPMIRYHRNKG